MVDIIPSSQRRPCAEIFKMASYEPIMQSMIDCFGQTMIGCENGADSLVINVP